MFSYHSCGNRSCPKCHTAQTQEWLERRQAEMLPVPYFHITITVPAELREVLRANQRDGYGVLMQACAAAIIELARDPRYVGGTVAVLAVLHTWTQQLILHPHVHCLVSGGGISEDATTWHPARRKFLVPIKALAKLVRGKFRALLRRKRPDLVIPDAVWRTPWILHVTAWGNGEQAVLDYLARYVFRVALTNARIVGLDDETVTIQYKERKTGRPRTCRLSGDEFMRRFLQHVLPRGFHKVRYFGLWHPAQRHNAARVRQMLQLQAPPKPDPPQELVLPLTRAPWRGANAADRAADLSALSSGAAGLHPHARAAHAATGHGAMIGNRSLRRHRPVLLLRASARHGDHLVTNAADGLNLAPDDAADRLETATPDRNTAVVPRRPRRPSRDYQPSAPSVPGEISIAPIAAQRPAFVQRSFCGGFAPHKLLIRYQTGVMHYVGRGRSHNMMVGKDRADIGLITPVYDDRDRYARNTQPDAWRRSVPEQPMLGASAASTVHSGQAPRPPGRTSDFHRQQRSGRSTCQRRSSNTAAK